MIRDRSHGVMAKEYLVPALSFLHEAWSSTGSRFEGILCTYHSIEFDGALRDAEVAICKRRAFPIKFQAAELIAASNDCANAFAINFFIGLILHMGRITAVTRRIQG